jgi:hypothetical protein
VLAFAVSCTVVPNSEKSALCWLLLRLATMPALLGSTAGLAGNGWFIGLGAD